MTSIPGYDVKLIRCFPEYDVKLVRCCPEYDVNGLNFFFSEDVFISFADIQLAYQFNVDEEIICTFRDEGKCHLGGVTSLQDKIYVICRESNQVFVFPDHKPFHELKEERIEIKKLTKPVDIAASTYTRSIFVSDGWTRNDHGVVWKIQMPGKEVSRWNIRGKPFTLSITPSDQLLVAVHREMEGNNYRNWHLDVLEVSDGTRIKSISLPAEIVVTVHHAVQLSNGNFIVLFVNNTDPDDWDPKTDVISELSSDGQDFIRTFDPRSDESIKSEEGEQVRLTHLSVDEGDQIFAADYYGDRVFLFNSTLSGHRVVLDKDSINSPRRLWYAAEQRCLLVGQSSDRGMVSVYNRHAPKKHRRG